MVVQMPHGGVSNMRVARPRMRADRGHRMTTPRASLATDLKIIASFSTRLPVAQTAPIEGGDIARASWAFPVVGALLGGAGALVYWVAFRLGLAPALAAALTLATTLALTGCLHEDGLADTADGFGGGGDRERKHSNLRDRRVGH